jgi:hypothetical protein
MSTQRTLFSLVKRQREQAADGETDEAQQTPKLKKPRTSAVDPPSLVGPSTANPLAIKLPDFDISSGVHDRPGKAILKDPDLDLLYFQPFLRSPERKILFEYLLHELPWYRVRLSFAPGLRTTETTKGHVPNPRDSYQYPSMDVRVGMR